jgi:hypothetical protein
VSPGVVVGFGQQFRRQLAGGDDLARAFVPPIEPQAARADVRLGVHREEMFALGVAQDRFKAAQQRLLGLRQP